MGCNCKKKVNKKYSDGDNGAVERGSVGMFLNITLNVFLNIMVFVLAVVATPFAEIFLIINNIRGKDTLFTLPIVKFGKQTDNGGKQELQD